MSEPRWLDPDERESWLQLARLLVRLPAALDAQLRRDADLTHFDYQVLAALSERDDRSLRMSTLASYADGSLSRLSQVVARLEGRGFVERSPDPDDGRYTVARLTDAGWDKIVASAPAHVEEVRRLVLDPLTPAQVEQLRAIGDRINGAIDTDPC